MKKMFYWGVVAICLIGQISAALNPPSSAGKPVGAVKKLEAISGAKKRKQISFYTGEDLESSNSFESATLKRKSLFCEEDDNFLIDSDSERSPVKKAREEHIVASFTTCSPATKEAKRRRYAPVCEHKVAAMLLEKSRAEKHIFCPCGKK